MKHIAGVVIVSMGSALLAGAMIGDTKEQPAAPSSVFSRFSGTAKVNATSLRVEIKDWQLVRTPQGIRIPVTGFHLVQLTSGKVDTEIAGRREHRKAGDFWTVAAGETMIVHFPPHSQAAKIKTIAINR